MKKFFYYFWAFLILIIAFLWSVEIALWVRKIPPLGDSLLMVFFIPFWFYFNFKWVIRAIKMPPMFYAVTEVLSTAGVKTTISYRLALTAKKIDEFKKYTKIRLIKKGLQQHIRENLFILPAVILEGETEEQEEKTKQLSRAIYDSNPAMSQFYSQNVGRLALFMFGSPVFILSVFPFLVFLLLLLPEYVDVAEILNSWAPNPTTAGILTFVMLVLCSLAYFSAGTIIFFYNTAYLAQADKKYLSFVSLYLKSSNYVYAQRPITLSFEDKAAILMTITTSALTLLFVLNFFIKISAF
jgi:hypothetical protein